MGRYGKVKIKKNVLKVDAKVSKQKHVITKEINVSIY